MTPNALAARNNDQRLRDLAKAGPDWFNDKYKTR